MRLCFTCSPTYYWIIDDKGARFDSFQLGWLGQAFDAGAQTRTHPQTNLSLITTYHISYENDTTENYLLKNFDFIDP